MPHDEEYKDKKREKLRSMMDKVKMKDAGKELDLPSGDKKTYPTLRLNEEQLDAISHKEVGDTCELLVETKMTSKKANMNEDEKEQSATLEVKEIGYIK